MLLAQRLRFGGLWESTSVPGTASADWSSGKAIAMLSFSLLVLLTEWRTGSPLAG